MKTIKQMILEHLNKLSENEEEEVLEEEGQIAAPATDSSATGGTLPVPMLGKKVVKRKSLEDKED